MGRSDSIAERVLFGLAFVTRFFHLADPAQIVRGHRLSWIGGVVARNSSVLCGEASVLAAG